MAFLIGHKNIITIDNLLWCCNSICYIGSRQLKISHPSSNFMIVKIRTSARTCSQALKQQIYNHTHAYTQSPRQVMEYSPYKLRRRYIHDSEFSLHEEIKFLIRAEANHAPGS